MIVTANSLASVNFVTGTWQIEMGFMVCAFYVNVFYSHVPVQGDEQLSELFVFIGYFALCYHTFCFCVKIGCAINKNTISYLRSLVMLFTMFVMVILMLFTTKAAYLYNQNTNYKSFHNQCMYQFLLLHLYSYISIILSYVCFMAFRSCTRHKLHPELEMPEYLQLPILDTLVGLQFIAAMWVNSVYPVFMTLMDTPEPQDSVDGHKWIKLQRDSIIMISGIQSLFTFCHIFVSWDSGPQFWVSCAPYFYFVAMMFNYIIVPCGFTAWFVVYMIDPKLNLVEDNETVWNLIYTTMLVGNLVDWLIDGRARFMLQKDIFFEKRDLIQMQNDLESLPADDPNREEISNKIEQLMNTKFEREKADLVPYRHKPRGMGEGYIRVGEKMEMSKEIYTLSFISNLEIEYIEHFVCIMTAQLKNPKTNKVDTYNLSQKEKHVLELLDPVRDLSPLELNEQKLLLLQKKDIVISKRAMIFQNTQLSFVCQASLCILILWQILVLDASLLDMFDNVLIVIICRFIAAIILHLALMDELVRALSFMKFAVNHPYMFRSWASAYVSALQQVIILILVEVICVSVVCISVAPLEIVFNFIALSIIADFDTYIYSSYADCLKKMIDNETEDRPVLTIFHTTSYNCAVHEKSESKDEDGNQRAMVIRFNDRDWPNRIGYLYYKLCRSFFVSFYFYFTPYTVLVISLGWPIVYLRALQAEYETQVRQG